MTSGAGRHGAPGGGDDAMRILIVVTGGDEIGGAQVHVRDLCRALHQRRDEVLVAFGTSGLLATMLDEIGVPWTLCAGLQREIDPIRDFRAIRSLFQIVRGFEPDLVAAHATKAGIVARIVGRLSHTPCVTNPHGWSFPPGVPIRQRQTYQLIERALAPLSDRIICVSEYDRRLAIQAGIPASRLVTIHNGVPDVPARLRAAHEPTTSVRIAMVARFTAQKDQALLLRAARDVSGIELHFLGDGPLLGEIRAECDRLCMSDRVRFHGQRTDVAAFLAGMDIFALTSRWEGFPLATLEAMRGSLPVVVTNVGGAGEAVRQEHSGFCIPPGDVERLRDALAALSTNADLRRRMGEAARRQYEAEYTFDAMFARTMSVYEDVIAAYQDPFGCEPRSPDRPGEGRSTPAVTPASRGDVAPVRRRTDRSAHNPKLRPPRLR